ncbi:MAG: NIPSNAP family protein [Bacteroidales bacterium]
MKRPTQLLCQLFCSILFIFPLSINAAQTSKEYFQIRIYHYEDASQAGKIESFLENAYLPALHRAGVKKAGVFKPIDDPEASDNRIFVFIPFKTLDQFSQLDAKLKRDKAFQKDGKAYLDAPFDDPPYVRLETILLHAFDYMPEARIPDLDSPPEDRIYELRSYESYTEHILANKIQMFNEGGEVSLFEKLEFNAVFYAEVISGSRMPNLMYMTSFADMKSREEHWAAFREHPDWKRISSMEEYQDNVSKIDRIMLHHTAYSDF